MSMMSMKDTTDRGETHIRSVGFLDECEDALDVIRAAKRRAQHKMMQAMEELRAVLEVQHDRIIGCRSEDSEIRWEKDCQSASDNIETDIDEMAFWTEHDIRAEKESY